MSRTIAVHVRYNSLYISLSSSAKQRREMTKSCVVWRTWTTTAKFLFYFSNLSLCSGFSFVIVLTVINKVSDFRVSWDSKINYKFIFCRRCPRRRRRGFVNSLLFFRHTDYVFRIFLSCSERDRNEGLLDEFLMEWLFCGMIYIYTVIYFLKTCQAGEIKFI